jgi:hypothetical protein
MAQGATLTSVTDMSPSLFEQLGSLDTGVLQIEWNFKAKGWSP